VIVLDDASTDRTIEVARSISDPRLTVVPSEVNQGAYAAANRSAALGRGPFIAMYNADDVYEPTIVEREVEALQENPALGGVFTLDHNIDQHGTVFATVSMPEEFKGRSSLDYATVFRCLVRRSNPFCCPTFMTRRAVLDEIGGFRPERWGIASDAELWIRIARRHPLRILDAPLMRYRKQSQQWTAQYRRLRTDPYVFFDVIEYWMREDGWRDQLSELDLVEYVFQRSDDDAFRAVNMVLKGDTGAARALLGENPYPWRSLGHGRARRKLRLLALRTLLGATLACGLGGPAAVGLRRLGP
jgi:glycosyltransferase involved in cell wall biosynthesis